MKLFIPKEQLTGNPIPPRAFLCTTGNKRIGELRISETSGDFKWNTYSEIQFVLHRIYTDILTGKTMVDPLFDKIEAPRTVELEGYGFFVIQDVDTTWGERDEVRVTCFSKEYSAGQRYLNLFVVNKGTEESKEVIYAADQYGEDARIEDMYKLASVASYDSNEDYFCRIYSDSRHYTYEQIQIDDETDYLTHFGEDMHPEEVLYIHGWAPVTFYDPNTPELSLLHLIFNELPEWEIGHVDYKLRSQNRSFEEDRVAIYDFIMEKVCDTFKAVAEWDTTTMTVNFYEEEEDGITDDGTIQNRWDTDIFVSRENLANQIDVKYSADNIKTKLKVSGADGLDIREINLGKNYIMNLDYYHPKTGDIYAWMEQDLYEAYDDYLEAIERYTPQYNEAVQNWVKANDKYSNLMNAVPVDKNVVLVGDPFKKLYCVYSPMVTTELPEFNDIYNKQFSKMFTACAQTWIDAATSGKVVYGTLSTDETDYMAIRVNPMLYATRENKKFTNTYRDIYSEVQSGKQASVNCITLCNMILMGIPYESSRLCNDENIIGAGGYGFDICKLFGENSKLDINTFTKILNQTSFFETYSTYGLTKTIKSSPMASDGDIWYNDIRPGDIMYEEGHSMFCLDIENITNGVKITFVDASTTHEPNIMISSFTATSSKSERPIIRVARPYYSYYAGNEIQTPNLKALTDKLTLYHINEDIGANQTDNYLLRLRNKDSDLASIRIYNANTTGTDEEKKANPDYKIQVIITYAQNGIISAAKTYSMEEWINGKLTAEYMELNDYTVEYIGIMGAYFVLAKDETNEATLEEYGINLLKEKHKIYMTIFQSQTEAMFSQEKCQCIAQNMEPEGDFEVGTKWLDTDSKPVILKEYNGTSWVEISATMSETDQKDYENYQRYIDNYNKMVAVQNMLIEKEKQAAYMYDGSIISNRKIDINLYTKGADGILRYNGQTLEGDMKRIAETHFIGHTITKQSIDQSLPIYYFTTSYDLNNIFAVYLKGTTPYIAHADSQGVYQAIMNWISKEIDIENFFTEDQWIRLSPFIREDEFSDSNFLLTGNESEKERLEICQELMDAAAKELKTLSQPSLEFSMEMANILALPEFAPLFDQFQLGNFVRVHIRDGYVKRARLLEVHINFDDLSDFNCNFGNLVTAKSEVDKHAELLSQAVNAGKQVAQSAGNWQRAVDKSNKLEEDISNGLTDVTLEIGKTSGQSIELGQYGLRGRKLIDGTTDQYEDEQVALINNKLVFTADGWKTSKAAFGKFTIKDENGNEITHWGMLSDAVVSGYISGSTIEGGTLKIGGDGGEFIVNKDGSVNITVNGQEKYASTDAIKEIDNAYRFHTVLSYDKSTIFADMNQDCTITCMVYDYDKDITEQIINTGGSFSWIRVSSDLTNDNTWNSKHIQTGANANKIKLKTDDIERNSQFSCTVDFDETKITT